MKTVLALVVCSLLSAVTLGQDPTKTTGMIVGTWKPTKGKLPAGTTVEFTKDGKMRINLKLCGKTVSAEGNYRVDGNRITTTDKGLRGKQETKTARIKKLTNTELIIEDAKGQTMEFKRVNESP
jgi:uncharacterized protein (TIGR03066 family)